MTTMLVPVSCVDYFKEISTLNILCYVALSPTVLLGIVSSAHCFLPLALRLRDTRKIRVYALMMGALGALKIVGGVVLLCLAISWMSSCPAECTCDAVPSVFYSILCVCFGGLWLSRARNAEQLGIAMGMVRIIGVPIAVVVPTDEAPYASLSDKA
jgi:hypothetical protein